jgi:hypothetical protein
MNDVVQFISYSRNNFLMPINQPTRVVPSGRVRFPGKSTVRNLHQPTAAEVMEAARAIDAEQKVDTRAVAENIAHIQHRYFLLMRGAPRNMAAADRQAILQKAILAKEGSTM